MSSYLSYTRGIRDKPIDTVAAVYFLQLSIADFVFWGLHLLIQTNNNLLSISVAKGMKVFILDGTIYIARVSEQCYIVCVCVCGMHIYTHFNINFTCHFRKYADFCTGAKSTDFTHTVCTSCSMCWQTCVATQIQWFNIYSTYASICVHDMYVWA